MKNTTLSAVSAAVMLAAGALAPAAAFAETKTNPVTGATETYENVFTGGAGGTATEWNDAANWQLKEESKVPFVSSGNYDPALVSNATVSTSTAIDGWNLCVGAYSNATITLSHVGKIQGNAGMWLTVDNTSSIIIDGWGGGNLGQNGQTLSYYVANENGVTWNADLNNGTDQGLTIDYYLAGEGSVAYKALERAAHVIKRADVTLSGTSRVASKTLVSFTSTTKTFTADAAIKVYATDGSTLAGTENLATITISTTGATTLTTADRVGSCELVQTSTGIMLYYVDGATYEPKTYKPSIDINFTSGAANGLTTSADVGLEGYAVPGTSWNNFVVANNATFNTVNAIDSTGAASVASGVSVSISGTRGSYSCNSLTPSSNPLHGYIDENAGNSTPTVTVTGIPYYKYRVLVYHSTDSGSVPFGYDTINGTNYTYVNDALSEGATAWGASGAQDSANAIAEGGNVLVTEALSGSTLTVVGHRAGGASNARGCIAAIQIIEVKPEAGEGDLIIEVSGATTYTVNEAKTLSGTVYVIGQGTLTLDGSAKTMNVNADRLDGTTFIGAGTVVYDGTAPVEGKGWSNIGWSGTVWIKNQAVSAFEGTKFGNAGSTVRFTGVSGYLQTSSWNSSTYVHTVPLELVDEGETVAFTYNNGWGGNLVKINTLKGTGTLKTQGSGLGEHIYIVDASGFTGAFNLTGKYVYVGGSQPDYSASTNPNGKLEIRSGVTMTVPSGKTWTANGGFVVNGTLNVDGTLASSHTTKAVSGAGTVVFTGRAPTVSGNAWWKNADWTGTVQVKDVTNMVGDSRTGVWLKFNDYGNSGSVVEMNNVTGWLETGYTCTPKLKITGTLYLNNGGSGKASAFKVGTLLGSGTISGDGSAVTVVFNITDDWSGFTGTIGLNNKCVVFGSTIPESDNLTAGTIYISEGAVVTPQQTSGTWWAVGGIKVDGELRAPNLDKFGGGTTITTTDNGVFTLVTNSNADDMNVDYARIQGTGTLRLDGTAYRCISTNNFPTAMTVDNRLTAGFLHRIPGLEITIGSLAGNGYLRSDWSGSAGDRDLRVLQAKDTTWSGNFWTSNPHRFRSLIVAPGATTSGTLTISATHVDAESTGLAVESGAAVNLTGTWIGATTVAGTFGGTGTLEGSLTFSDGATFKAGASELTVSGTVTTPGSGTVAVDVSAISESITASGVMLISGGVSSVGTFAVDSAYRLAVDGDALKVYPAVTYVAEYDGVQYETFAKAIEAAEAAGGTFADVTVLDDSAVPEGYYKDANDRLAMYQAAVVDTDGTAHYYPTAQAAVDDVDSYRGMGTEKAYSYFAVFFGTDVAISVNLSKMSWATLSKTIKFKCSTGVTVSVAPSSEEYELAAGEPDADGIVAYAKNPKATTYFWAGTGSTSQPWGRPDKWKVGSAEGDAATRAPSTLDTVVIDGGAPVNEAGGVTVAAIKIGGTAVVIGSGTLAATGGIVLTDAAATLTVTGLTLSPAPSSGVEGYHVWTSSDGSSTVYSLAAAGDTTAVEVEDSGETYTVPRGWAVSHGIASVAALATAGANGIPAWQSYFLGLDPQDASSVVLCEGAPGAQTQDGEIALVAKNLLKPAGADGVAVTCRLQRWNGTEWIDAGNPVVAAAGQPVTLKYDASSGSAGFQRFRVAVTIAPAP